MHTPQCKNEFNKKTPDFQPLLLIIYNNNPCTPLNAKTNSTKRPQISNRFSSSSTTTTYAHPSMQKRIQQKDPRFPTASPHHLQQQPMHTPQCKNEFNKKTPDFQPLLLIIYNNNPCTPLNAKTNSTKRPQISNRF